MKNQLKKLMDKYKQDVIILFHYNDDDMHKVENAPLGSLIIDYYAGNGYIKNNNDFSII
jgi:hypothetical protein